MTVAARTASPSVPGRRGPVRMTGPLWLVCAITVVLALAACTSSGGAPTSSPPAAGTTAVGSPLSSTAVTSPAVRTPPAHRLTVNPFTGRGPVPTLPVIAVKIDDTAPGRPQRGIDRADVVYIEEVEAGLSRLLAVFGTNKPVVGYVRSTRPSDPDLLLQYGKITEAASGGGHDSLPLLRKSGIRGWINDNHARYYSRVSRFESSYINLILDLSRVAKAVHTPRPRSIGWRFSAALPAKGTVGTHVQTRVGSQLVDFRWYPRLKKYVRFINGVAQRAADGSLIAASNVVVQHCRIVPHPKDTDINGNPSQFTITVGKGAVSVFRNGRRIDGSWSRPRLHGGTTLKTRGGKALTLKPGNTWVALVRPKTSVSGS